MAYIDPITGAYVADSLDALPPGYNQPKAGNEANVAKMRAQLNNSWENDMPIPDLTPPKTDPFSLVKKAYEHMPGAGVVQGIMPSILGMPQFLASLGYGLGNQVVNPQTANFDKDTTNAMRAMQYTPPTQSGKDISNFLGKVGEATGPLPELWNTGMRFTPDDLRVAGRTATEDFRNFGSDYANAKAGVQREYPTAGSRAAQFTDVAGDLSRPLAEKAYDMYMNPESSVEVYGMRPGANLSGLATAGGPMYAVKPKGGNWPTNLGSTAPLKEQGKMGAHLSEVQITDPYEKWLDLIKNRGGDAKYYFDKFVGEKKSSGELGDEAHYSPAAWKEKLQEIAEEYTRDYNKIKSEENENYTPIFSPSQLQHIAPRFNTWAMSPYQKYITNQMGTGLPTDPYLKEINEANIPLHELFGLNPGGGNFTRGEDAAKRRAQFLRYNQENPNFDLNAPQNANIGKQTATTEFGKQLEDYLDNTLYPSNASFYRPEKFPQVSKIPGETVVTDFLVSDPWKQTGLHAIQNRMMQDLVENKIDIDKISNRTPALIARDMINEYKVKQKSKDAIQKAKDDWRRSRFESIQSDVPYADGSKMQVITPEDVKTESGKNLAFRDLGQSTIDLKQCIGAGCMNTPDYQGHGPYLEPHTGKPARQVADYKDTHVKRYMERLEQGKAEIARLLDPKGVAQASIDLHFEAPRTLRVSQQEAAIARWLEDHDPQGLLEFESNVANFGTAEAVKNAYQLYPEVYQHIEKLNGKPKKYISEMKGHSNGKVAEEFVPHMVEWLNKNAEDLSDVRDLDKLPGVHDLTRSYDAVGKMVDQHPHWYSPTVEQFFDEMEKEKGLPRFFTTDDFALKATERGVDLSAEPPKQLKDWEKQHISEELYLVLNKKPESLFLQNNFKDEMAEPLKLIIGDETPGVELPMEVHGKLAEMLLDHNGKYKDILDSALAQIAENGPNDWVNQFTEPQKQKMLNIMAGWFDKYPSKKLPTNTDFENAIAKHPNPFDEIKFYDQDWDKAPDNYWKHPETFGNTNGLVEAVRNMEPEVEQQLPFDRPEFPEALSQNMRDYFEGNAHNLPENMIEPYATETRILMGSQRPEARLDTNVHQELIRILLNQDRHTQDIRDLMNRLQRGNNLNILTEPQAENMLNMLISWTERYPLNE